MKLVVGICHPGICRGQGSYILIHGWTKLYIKVYYVVIPYHDHTRITGFPTLHVITMKSKDIAIVGILLAIGAILRYFLAMLHTPLTPNMIIAFYCLAIILIRPKIYEAIGIGFVAGILSMLISGSIFPPANLISEPLGALVCFGIYGLLKNRTKLAPTVTTFLVTLASGFSFAVLALVAVAPKILSKYATLEGFIIIFVPIVVITAIFNAVIVQILYVPSSRVLSRGQE